MLPSDSEPHPAAPAAPTPPPGVPEATALLDGVTDAFFALDREFRFTFLNARAEALLGRPRATAIGRCAWDEFPDAVGSPFWDECHRALRDGVTVTCEAYYAPLATWFSVRAYPAAGGLAVFIQDVAAQRSRPRLLADAGRTLGVTLDEHAAYERAADLIVPRLADACAIDRLEPHAGAPTGARARRVAVRPSIGAGRHPGGDPPVELPTLQEVGSPAALAMARGHGLLVRRGAAPPADDPDLAALYAWLADHELGAVAAVPLGERGRTVGAITAAVAASAGRPFEDDDLSVLEEIARQLAASAERARLLTEAQAARRAAEWANHVKSQFLAMMSHELRTPLNAVLGYADLLEAGVGGPLAEGQRYYVDRLRTSGHHLLSLIEDVLDFAKLEAGTLLVAHEPAPLGSVIVTADELVRLQSRRRGVRVDVDLPPASIHYVGDEDRVRQILVNLLTNAVKFTSPGGVVSVEWSVVDAGPARAGRHDANPRGPRDQTPVMRAADLTPPLPTVPPPRGGWVCVRVRDTGIGIPAESHERVFEPFVQVDASRTRTAEGTGLGLAISRQFARRMEGDLTVASVPGVGSVFALWLPAAESDRAALDARVRTHVELGRVVVAHVGEIVNRTVARLRTEPAVPAGSTAAQSDLENHLGAFLTDFAQQFTILDDEGADAVALLRDGSELQQFLVRKHGQQRHRLGWPAAAVEQEFAILAEEIAVAARGDAMLAGAEVDDVLALAGALLGEASRVALNAYRDAA